MAEGIFLVGAMLTVFFCVCSMLATVRATIIDAKNQKILDKMKGSR